MLTKRFIQAPHRRLALTPERSNVLLEGRGLKLRLFYLLPQLGHAGLVVLQRLQIRRIQRFHLAPEALVSLLKGLERSFRMT